MPSHSWNRKLRVYCVHSVGLIPILILLKRYERNDIKLIIKCNVLLGEYLKDIRLANKLPFNVVRVIHIKDEKSRKKIY